MTAEEKAWDTWVNYCCMVKAWYTKDQPEPFGMNPPNNLPTGEDTK